MRCNAIFIICLVLGLVHAQNSNNLEDILNALSGLDELGGLTSTWSVSEQSPAPSLTSPAPEAEEQQQGGVASFRAASTPDISELINIWEGQSPDMPQAVEPLSSPSIQVSINDLANLFSAWGSSSPAQTPSPQFFPLPTLTPSENKDVATQQQESPIPTPTPTPLPSPTPTPTPTPSPTLTLTSESIPEPEPEDLDEVIDDDISNGNKTQDDVDVVSETSPSPLPSPFPLPLPQTSPSRQPLPQLNFTAILNNNSNYDVSQEIPLTPPSPPPLPVTRNYANGNDVGNLDVIQGSLDITNISPSPYTSDFDQFGSSNTDLYNSQGITVDPASTSNSLIPVQIQEAIIDPVIPPSPEESIIDPVIPPSPEESPDAPVFSMPSTLAPTSNYQEASSGGSYASYQPSPTSSFGFPFEIPDNAVQVPSATVPVNLPFTIPIGSSPSNVNQQTPVGATFIPSQSAPPGFGSYPAPSSSYQDGSQLAASSPLPLSIPFGSSPNVSTPATPDTSGLPFAIPVGATAIPSVPAPSFATPPSSFPLGYGIPSNITPASPSPTPIPSNYGSLLSLIPTQSQVPAFMTQSPPVSSNIQGGVSNNVQGGVSSDNIQGGISSNNIQGGIQGGVSSSNNIQGGISSSNNIQGGINSGNNIQGGIQGGVSSSNNIQGGIQGGVSSSNNVQGGRSAPSSPATYSTGTCGRSDNPGQGTLCGCSNTVPCGFYACMELYVKNECENPDVSTPNEEVPYGYCDVTCGRCECCPSVLKQSRNLNLTVWADMLDAVQLASGGGTGPSSSVTQSLSNPSYTATVFVPTDEAFRKLYEEQQGQTREEFLSTIPPLQQIIQTHMLLGQAAIRAQGLWDGELGYTLPTQLGGSQSAFLSIEKGNSVEEMTISSPGATARIVNADINGCQSVIHIIDEVLLPYEPENKYG